ncbi:MAG: sulfotransferase [Phycisphaerales bacterium]
MTLPDFLIIGAMKSGTTSLYRDLLTHPRVFFPIDKEPGNLCHDDVLTDAGRARYEKLFERAGPDQLCAEASTAYTKRPTFEGVAERAKQLIPDAKLIYVIRDPIARLLSHHHHEHVGGHMGADVAEAIEKHHELLDYSRYAMQLDPWRDAFGEGAIRVVRFEDYVADRPGQTARVEEFLGLDPRPELVEVDKVHNKGEGKPVMTSGWRAVTHSGAYRRLIRPLLPIAVKDRLRAALLPKAPAKAPPPSQELLDRLRGELEPDLARLRELWGPSLRWDGGPI